MRFLTARVGIVAFMSVFLSGCGTLYKLDVIAAADSSKSFAKTYVLLPGSPELDIESAEFDNYAAIVERSLEPMGYRRQDVDQLSSAALGIYVSAGIGNASKRVHTVTQPIIETPYPENSPSTVRSSGGSSGGGGSGQSSQPPPPVTMPTREVLTGYQRSGFVTTVYTKFLSLTAIDLPSFAAEVARVGRENAVPETIWSIDIETTGQPSDLNEVVPVMLAGGQAYIGKATNGYVHLKISSTDKRVQAIQSDANE